MAACAMTAVAQDPGTPVQHTRVPTGSVTSGPTARTTPAPSTPTP
nr:hypothetical protein [Paenibacillus elgii]